MYFTGSFPYGNPFGFCEAWRASYSLIYSIRGWQANIVQYHWLVTTLQFSPRHLMKASAPWGRQYYEGVSLMETSAFREPFEASHGQWRTLWELDGHENSRQPVSSPSPHVVIGPLIFIPHHITLLLIYQMNLKAFCSIFLVFLQLQIMENENI